jgi:multidrug resistance efflux pump
MAQIIFLFFSGVFAGVAFMSGECITAGNAVMSALVAGAFYITAWVIHAKA